MIDKISDLKNKIFVMENYIKLKLSERDWHAVWDAAIDIQSLEEQLDIYKELLNEAK